MTDPIVELASMLDSGTASGEIMGTAAAASSGKRRCTSSHGLRASAPDRTAPAEKAFSTVSA